MKSLDEIREALRERERNRPKITGRPGRPRKGRPHTERTRAKLARISYERRRAEALADPDCHPLRRARVTFNGEGLSQRQLAERAVVCPHTIYAIESGRRQPSQLTARRLARALESTPEALGLE